MVGRRRARAGDAGAVRRMLDAGATLVGKTHTDELAYSIAGTNIHYGTPVNVNAPGRIPGGSSSGSAAAVAAGLVDFALGTDTGGSIRVPASYCGIFGLRPSWGRVPVDGLMPLAPSYDTAGPFARDPRLLGAVAAALFGTGDGDGDRPAVDSLVVPDDVWALADADAASALRGALERSGLKLEHVDLAGDCGGLQGWVQAFRAIQGAEAWARYDAWISSHPGALGPGVAERFQAGARITAEDLDRARPLRQQATDRVRTLLDGRRGLAIPSACGPAPTPEAAQAERADLRERTLRMTCVAGNAGAPVVSVPIAAVNGLPVGLSLVGTPGCDEQVLDLAVGMWEAARP